LKRKNPKYRMRIYSYNINGVRAALKKGLIEWLEKEAPDVICFQEIKAQEDQIPVEEFEKIGYHHYWYPAEKKGYSGVALLSKQKPDRVKLGCGIAEYDREGRILQADFGDITLLSCYFPSGSSGDERQAFKMKFLSDFEEYASQLSKERPKLIISGDVNICHEEIDIHNPKGLKKTSGFLPEERQWVSNFLDHGYIDAFRHMNKEPEHYSWWSYRAGARAKNKGWRIDYNFVSKALEGKISHAAIHPDAMHSDHCPVSVEIKL